MSIDNAVSLMKGFTPDIPGNDNSIVASKNYSYMPRPNFNIAPACTVDTCSDMLVVTWKYFKSPLRDSKLKHENTHRGPQLRT